MKAIIQRVKSARLSIDNNLFSEIKCGFLVYLGVGENDSFKEAEFLADKIAKLRIFEDDKQKMNKSILDFTGYEILVVSNFTLYAMCKGQNRPCFMAAAKPDIALPCYEHFCKVLNVKHGITVKTGVFGADMQIIAHNDGPINIILDTDEL